MWTGAREPPEAPAPNRMRPRRRPSSPSASRRTRARAAVLYFNDRSTNDRIFVKLNVTHTGKRRSTGRKAIPIVNLDAQRARVQVHAAWPVCAVVERYFVLEVL